MSKFVFNIRWENDDMNIWIEAFNLDEARMLIKQEYPGANYYTYLRKI